MSEPKKTVAKKSEPKFTKLGLTSGSDFTTTDKDIMNIVLDDDKQYTLAEVKQAIQKFKEGF